MMFKDMSQDREVQAEFSGNDAKISCNCEHQKHFMVSMKHGADVLQ